MCGGGVHSILLLPLVTRCINNNNNYYYYGLYTTYLRIWSLIKGVHKNAITMKIYMSTIIKLSIARRSCKIHSVLFNYFVDVLHVLF